MDARRVYRRRHRADARLRVHSQRPGASPRTRVAVGRGLRRDGPRIRARPLDHRARSGRPRAWALRSRGRPPSGKLVPLGTWPGATALHPQPETTVRSRGLRLSQRRAGMRAMLQARSWTADFARTREIAVLGPKKSRLPTMNACT